MAFNLILQLAQLQLLRESTPLNWQLASCALEQLAVIWGLPSQSTHLRPLPPDAIKDCSRLPPPTPAGSDDQVRGGEEARSAADLVNASQQSGIISV